LDDSKLEEEVKEEEDSDYDDCISPYSKDKHNIKTYIKSSFAPDGDLNPTSQKDFYRIGKILGRGAFGKVNLAIHKLSDHFVAIKSINKHYLKDECSKKKVMAEV
jgi:serine/threonine protein kinase